MSYTLVYNVKRESHTKFILGLHLIFHDLSGYRYDTDMIRKIYVL